MTDSHNEPLEHLEIDALLDGEMVDAQALRSALDEEAARDYLVEALMLRQMSREIGPMPTAIQGAARGGVLHGARWLAAGVILAIGVGAGYVYGQGSRARSAPSLVEVAIVNRPAPPAPAPTRFIRFEPGVNWTNEPKRH